MSTRNTLLGLGLTLLATLAFSVTYVFSKAAMNEISFAQFGVYWFAVALTINGLYFFSTGIYKKYKAMTKRNKRLIWLIATFELIGTSLFFYSIKLFHNPAVVSFIAALIPIFVAIISFFALHERFSLIETLGIILAITGAMVISYQSSVIGEMEHRWIALAISFIFVLVFAVNTVLMRISMRDAHPVMIGFSRTVLLLAFYIVLLIANHDSLKIPGSALKNIVIGASLGPFVGMLTSMWALKYIEATVSSTIVNAKGFLILIFAYGYLNIIPEKYQIYGGLLAVAGVALLSYGKYLKAKKTA